MLHLKLPQWKTGKEKLNNAQSPIKKLLGNKLYRQLALVVLSAVLCIVLVFAITTAWYSNVIYSDGLTFEASPWGFEGTATVGTDIIIASPGSSGVIPLTVTNPTEQIISVGINVSKNQMEQSIQQRIYFYADTIDTENGEKLDKVYINKLNNYEYTLFGNQEITSGGDKNNNVPIKWEWVYDVLGYYVLGSFSSEEPTHMVIEDYLRPIEYNYDDATFDKETGKLLTVDGTVTVGEFLAAITSSDGYKGTLNVEAEAYNGYYPVDTDKQGYGVWIYLCNRGEIEYAMTQDTKLGEAANSENQSSQFSAVLNIIGQQKKLNIVEATSTDAFVNSFTDAECDMVKLTTDISVNSTITVPANRDIIVDLNGHVMNTSVAGDMITLEPGSELTVMNGTVTGDGSKNYAFLSKGGDLSLINVKTENVYNSLYIQDQNASGYDSKTLISNCELKSSGPTVMIFGNGLGSDRLTCLTIENSTLNSENHVAIIGNGTSTGDGYWGTDIVLKDSKIIGYWGAIYQPQRDSYLKAVNCQMSGYTTVAVKGGTVILENCKISSEDPENKFTPTAPSFSSSGYTDTGDGVYVETNYGWKISVEITGDQTEIISDDGFAVRQYEGDATNATVTVKGGSFSSDVSKFIDEELYTQTAINDGKLQYKVEQKDWGK